MIEVRPLTGVIGAEIHGVDLRDDLDDATVNEIRAALDAHLVIFFRDQRLEAADYMRFARKFGDISINPFGPKHPDHPTALLTAYSGFRR